MAQKEKTCHKTYHTRKNPLESLRCCLSFWLAAIEAILEGKERLPDRVGVGHPGIVQEGDVTNSPTLQHAVNSAVQECSKLFIYNSQPVISFFLHDNVNTLNINGTNTTKRLCVKQKTKQFNLFRSSASVLFF